jgi:hypothetical protein
LLEQQIGLLLSLARVLVRKVLVASSIGPVGHDAPWVKA